MNRNVVVASDHNGIRSKQETCSLLTSLGYTPIDLGPYDAKNVDYVDYAYQVANVVSSGGADRGVLICGTGVGMSIVANRVPGVRASLVHGIETAQKTREHNDSNVICLGEWINSVEDNMKILEKWLSTPYGAGRHQKRLAKIDPTSGVVMTNGVFDVLHRGHLQLLEFAASCGKRLIVAIDSDDRVRRLKGPDRPVNDQNLRRDVLSSLRCVDEVVIFDTEEELREIVRVLMPESIVKGGEWSPEEIRERDDVPAEVKIMTLPLVPGQSTTEQLKKIREMSTHEKIDPGHR